MYNKGGTRYIVGMYVQQGGNRIYCRYVCTTRGNRIYCRYVCTTRGEQDILLVCMYNKGGTGYIVGMYVQQGGNRIY
jgi:chitinase